MEDKKTDYLESAEYFYQDGTQSACQLAIAAALIAIAQELHAISGFLIPIAGATEWVQGIDESLQTISEIAEWTGANEKRLEELRAGPIDEECIEPVSPISYDIDFR